MSTHDAHQQLTYLATHRPVVDSPAAMQVWATAVDQQLDRVLTERADTERLTHAAADTDPRHP